MLALLLSVTFALSQAAPAETYASVESGLRAGVFRFEDPETSVIETLVGPGERFEHTIDGPSGPVGVVATRAPAGRFMVMFPTTEPATRACQVSADADFGARLEDGDVAAGEALAEAIGWCLRRVSPLVVAIPPLPAPRPSN